MGAFCSLAVLRCEYDFEGVSGGQGDDFWERIRGVQPVPLLVECSSMGLLRNSLLFNATPNSAAFPLNIKGSIGEAP